MTGLHALRFSSLATAQDGPERRRVDRPPNSRYDARESLRVELIRPRSTMSASGHSDHEGATARPKHAGFRVRFAAAVVDVVAMGVPAYLLVSIIFGPDWALEEDPWSVGNVLNAALLAVVTVLLWVNWDGRTPGKKVTRIRIVSHPDYGGLSYWKATVRTLVSVASALPFLIGYVVIAFMVGLRSDKRGFHDLIAGTCAVHDE